MNDQPRDLIDLKRAARLAGLHVNAVRRLVFTGRLARYRGFGQRHLVSASELQELLKARGPKKPA